jgi:hypothetical protein
MPLVGYLVAGLLVPLVAPFASRRFWQDDLQRLRSISETRVKRLEAVEKAVSVAVKAKAELGIDVTSCDIKSELQQIIHEFAAPSVLSLEALEEWISNPSKTRRLIDPKFDVPVEEARSYRCMRSIHKVGEVCFFVYWLGVIIFVEFYPGKLKSIVEYLAAKFSTPQVVVAAVILFVLPLYFLILHFLGPRVRERKARQALEKLRAMVESSPPGPATRDAAQACRGGGRAATGVCPTIPTE